MCFSDSTNWPLFLKNHFRKYRQNVQAPLRLKFKNGFTVLIFIGDIRKAFLSLFTIYSYTLRWRHNGRDGISNNQPDDCLLNLLFRRRSKKHQSSASLAFVWGIMSMEENISDIYVYFTSLRHNLLQVIDQIICRYACFASEECFFSNSSNSSLYVPFS